MLPINLWIFKPLLIDSLEMLLLLAFFVAGTIFFNSVFDEAAREFFMVVGERFLVFCLGFYVVLALMIVVDGAIFGSTRTLTRPETKVRLPIPKSDPTTSTPVDPPASDSKLDIKRSVGRARNWAIGGLVLGMGVGFWSAGNAFKKDRSGEAGKRRGTILFRGLWVGFCTAAWIGHWAGSFLGLIGITIPAVIAFWWLLYHFSHFLLPLDEGQSVKQAFRCLWTFSAGTNYPYYVMEEREKVERVKGNQFGRPEFIGPQIYGPGIFLTGPDHVVATSDGLAFKGVRGPGVVFTHVFETVLEPMDLRPQQRVFTVNAQTRDGIPLEFTTFGPFQLDTGEQKPKLGGSFPFRSRSIFKAFHRQPVEINRQNIEGYVYEDREQLRWDELYALTGIHVMQDIMGEYTFDQLCEPFESNKDPRTEITRKYKLRMQEEMSQYGIKVPGGGISNLFPSDREDLLSRRVKSWQAQQQRKVFERLGEAEARMEFIMGQAQAEVQTEMIRDMGNVISGLSTLDEEIIFSTMALHFFEALNKMVDRPEVKERIPSQSLGALRRAARVIGDREK